VNKASMIANYTMFVQRLLGHHVQVPFNFFLVLLSWNNYEAAPVRSYFQGKSHTVPGRQERSD
jgi:hypothetical protein